MTGMSIDRDLERFDDALAAFPTDSQQRADDLGRAGTTSPFSPTITTRTPSVWR
jgi:hypothetical protein